jgi:hypothetical protein
MEEENAKAFTKTPCVRILNVAFFLQRLPVCHYSPIMLGIFTSSGHATSQIPVSPSHRGAYCSNEK